jgi:hypothetical protein
MKKNVGTADTVVRVIFAVLVAVLYLTGIISGTLAIVLGILALVLLLTGLIGWCGLYAITGVNTCKSKTEEKE